MRDAGRAFDPHASKLDIIIIIIIILIILIITELILVNEPCILYSLLSRSTNAQHVQGYS